MLVVAIVSDIWEKPKSLRIIFSWGRPDVVGYALSVPKASGYSVGICHVIVILCNSGFYMVR